MGQTASSASCPFNPGDERGRSNAEGIADSKERVEGRRFLIVLQAADVSAVEAGRKCQVFLGHPGSHSRFLELFAEHAGQLSGAAD